MKKLFCRKKFKIELNKECDHKLRLSYAADMCFAYMLWVEVPHRGHARSSYQFGLYGWLWPVVRGRLSVTFTFVQFDDLSSSILLVNEDVFAYPIVSANGARIDSSDKLGSSAWHHLSWAVETFDMQALHLAAEKRHDISINCSGYNGQPVCLVQGMHATKQGNTTLQSQLRMNRFLHS
jgi:hypothetical protein